MSLDLLLSKKLVETEKLLKFKVAEQNLFTSDPSGEISREKLTPELESKSNKNNTDDENFLTDGEISFLHYKFLKE